MTPTSGHIFFIPGMILIGMFLGFILGTRAARNHMDLQRRRDEEREAARAARAAKRAAAEPKPVAEANPASKPEGGKTKSGKLPKSTS